MSEAETCRAPGCHNSTREKKPFCPDHVEMHPYVQQILAEMAEQQAELAKVRQKDNAQHVTADSLTVRELINHLRVHGSRTIERLARELNLEAKLVKRYVNALVSRKILKRGRTKRGNVIVRLVDERADNSPEEGSDS